MRNLAAQSAAREKVQTPRITVVLTSFFAARNNYQFSSYYALHPGSASKLSDHPRKHPATLQHPVRGENPHTPLANRFTGGATFNSHTRHADRTSGSRSWHFAQ